ncbi:glutathione synthase [Roseateles sp. BYS180W]|uniref:Glutathione synthetase n=1 Tax=Roseateles rivi TaxID=3299028 RepID=A0ABW7FQR8_9BURK
MKLLTIADPLHGFKTYKDSTFAMLRQAARRGHELWCTEAPDLAWRHGGRVTALAARRIALSAQALASGYGQSVEHWFEVQEHADLPLAETDAVLMRTDPPFDSEFFYATQLLSQAQREGARVFNDPSALREHPEKLAILEFPQHTAPTLVTRSAAQLRAFHAEHHDVIFKPLDGMGGMGIFRVGPDGMNLGAIIETLNRDGAQTVMAQRRIAEIDQGDKRVLLIGGQVVPYALARIPQGGEVRGNLAAGGKGVAMPITEAERAIAEHLAPILHARGLMLVGLDVIGGRLTEINVTSPTCFQEIGQQTGCDVAALFVDALERAVAQA